MSDRPSNALSAARVSTVKKPGRYADGNGLYLVVDPTGNKRWIQRLTISGRRTDLGLGGYPVVPLKDARDAALVNRRVARAGADPRIERRRAATPTFAEAAERVITLRRPDWRHPKTAQRWEATLRTYAYPFFGNLPVDQVSSADVLQVLSPIWTEKAETARAVRGHIRDVMDWAIAQEYRYDNPAGEAVRLGLKGVRRARSHYKALHYSAVCSALRIVQGSHAWVGTKLAFEFLVLTAARSGEIRYAQWSEVDLEGRTWTIPAKRMKTTREHRVPLSSRALEVLVSAGGLDNGSGFIFPSSISGKQLSSSVHLKLLRELGISAVPHGFRSSFRDWAAELTDAPHAVMEASLAHTVPNATEAAYARSDLFDRRRRLMQQWADYLSAAPGVIIPMVRRSA